MTSPVTSPPLDLLGLIPTLVVVWIAALPAAWVETAIARSRGRASAQPFLYGAVRYASWGSMFTVFGVAQHAYMLGLMSFRLEVFTILMAALAVACTGWSVRLISQARSIE